MKNIAQYLDEKSILPFTILHKEKNEKKGIMQLLYYLIQIQKMYALCVFFISLRKRKSSSNFRILYTFIFIYVYFLFCSFYFFVTSSQFFELFTANECHIVFIGYLLHNTKKKTRNNKKKMSEKNQKHYNILWIQST